MKPKSYRILPMLMAGGFALLFSLNTTRAAEQQKSPSATVKHADAKQAAQLVTQTNVLVLDVRTPAEFAGGHITGATNIDFLAGDFAKKLNQLDRAKTYLVHCGTGRRSTNCLPQLGKLGFTNLIHLDGGFKAWQAAGNPVEEK